MKVYYVYELDEDKNEYGNPYIGLTCRPEGRAWDHKHRLGLDYIPTLHIVSGPFINRSEGYQYEQEMRWMLGWEKEYAQGEKNVELKLGFFGWSEEAKREQRCKAGKKNVESGHIQALGKSSGHKHNLIQHNCPFCNKSGYGNRFKSYHVINGKCKYKNNER